MALDLATAQSYLDSWIAAQAGLVRNESYTLTFPNGQSRTLTRASGDEIRNQITYWHRVVTSLTTQAAGDPSPGVKRPVWT